MTSDGQRVVILDENSVSRPETDRKSSHIRKFPDESANESRSGPKSRGLNLNQVDGHNVIETVCEQVFWLEITSRLPTLAIGISTDSCSGIIAKSLNISYSGASARDFHPLPFVRFVILAVGSPDFQQTQRP